MFETFLFALGFVSVISPLMHELDREMDPLDAPDPEDF